MKLPSLFYDNRSFVQPLWVILYREYMYTSTKLHKVIWKFITEFKHDKHLVG